MIEMAESGKVSCNCGACALELNDVQPKMSLLCACEDCRQARHWAAKHGAATPKDIIYSVYFRSDFAAFHGVENMFACQLRADARSTRILCKSCYSCISIDHKVSYSDHVFMFQPDHCKADFDTDVTPIAAINLIDYPHHLAPIPSELLPVFHTFRYPQERARFVAIDPVFEVFAPPKTPPQGQTIRELIAALPAARVLDLAPGEQP